MYYKCFLSLLAQFTSGTQGLITLEDQEIRVTSRAGNLRWELSSKIFNYSEEIPYEMMESFSSTGRLQLEAANLYLQLTREDGSVSLIMWIPSPKKYTEFKAWMERYFEALSLWKRSRPDLRSEEVI